MRLKSLLLRRGFVGRLLRLSLDRERHRSRRWFCSWDKVLRFCRQFGERWGGLRQRRALLSLHARKFRLERRAQLFGELEFFARTIELFLKRRTFLRRDCSILKRASELLLFRLEHIFRLSKFLRGFHRLRLHLLSHDLESIRRGRGWCGSSFPFFSVFGFFLFGHGFGWS